MEFAGVPDPLQGRFDNLGDIISAALPYVFIFASIVAVLYLIYGGFRYMTARGDPKALDSARSTINTAVIGIIIILLVGLIFTFIGSVLEINILSSFIPQALAAPGDVVDIGCAVKLGDGQCIASEFPNFGALFTVVVRAILFVAALVFFIMVIFAGFSYINAGGDMDQATAARSTITNGAIGLLIILVSFLIIELVRSFVGLNNIFT